MVSVRCQKSRSPSYFRRQARRKWERESVNETKDEESTLPTAEKVVEAQCVEESGTILCDQAMTINAPNIETEKVVDSDTHGDGKQACLASPDDASVKTAGVVVIDGNTQDVGKIDPLGGCKPAVKKVETDVAAKYVFKAYTGVIATQNNEVSRNALPPRDNDLSAIDNLKNLTRSLDSMSRMRSQSSIHNTLS